MDNPITLRTLIYAFLFVVCFPVSLVFVFPRTVILLVFLAILPLTIVPSRAPIPSNVNFVEARSEVKSKSVTEEDCPHGLAEDKKSCWFPLHVEVLPEECFKGHWSVKQICELQNR